MTDTKELLKRISESGYKLQFIAQKCWLTYQGLKPKLDGEREFTQMEIAVLRDLLQLSADEVDSIFFTRE